MNKIKKICFSRIDKMGDMILTIPILKGIKKLNPDIKIDVLASSENAKILKTLSNIEPQKNIKAKNTARYCYKFKWERCKSSS